MVLWIFTKWAHLRKQYSDLKKRTHWVFQKPPFYHLQKMSYSPLPQREAISNFCCHRLVLSAFELYRNILISVYISVYIHFCLDCITQHYDCKMLYVAVIYLFSLLYNIPLYGCPQFMHLDTHGKLIFFPSVAFSE